MVRLIEDELLWREVGVLISGRQVFFAETVEGLLLSGGVETDVVVPRVPPLVRRNLRAGRNGVGGLDLRGAADNGVDGAGGNTCHSAKLLADCVINNGVVACVPECVGNGLGGQRVASGFVHHLSKQPPKSLLDGG